MEDEGETFMAHLGLGTEWGEPTISFRRVHMERPASGHGGGSQARATASAALAGCIEVAAGRVHSLFLARDGTVFSCGGGWDGALGHGDEVSCAVPRPLTGFGRIRVESVAAGDGHSMALSAGGGAVWSWGWGRHGQLGHNDRRNSLMPKRIAGLGGGDGGGGGAGSSSSSSSSFGGGGGCGSEAWCGASRIVQLVCGGRHSLVLGADGSVWAFGRAVEGQLGVERQLVQQEGEEEPKEEVCVCAPRRVLGALSNVRVLGLAAAEGGSTAQGVDGTRYRWGHGCPLPTQVEAEGASGGAAAAHEPAARVEW